MHTQFARPWNTTGKTWISVSVPGPWAVDNSDGNSWGIIQTDTGRTKKIGSVGGRRLNYFDKAVDAAETRNRDLLLKSGQGHG